MTTINAIRFNRYEGACICDESITSSDEMRIDVADKIVPCLPPVLVEKYGMVAAAGSTGTCSFGDEIKQSIRLRLLAAYEEEIEKHGRPPAKFMNFDKIAPLVFDIIVEQKNNAITRKFMGDYGFNLAEFLESSYTRNGRTFDIKDKDTIRELTALMTWKYQQGELSSIFLNAFVLACYDEENGFNIYHYDLRSNFYWHKVQTCYVAEGSGRHSVDPMMYGFAENLLVADRRGNIDRVAGLMAFLYGVVTAMDHEIGVGGYPAITIINGREANYQNRIREIHDDRAHLAAQIVRGIARNYMAYQDGYALIAELMYGGGNFAEVYDKMMAKIRNVRAFVHMLRGYKIMPYHEDILV
jgi:hypothetical protein